MEEHLYTLLSGAVSFPVAWGTLGSGTTLPRAAMYRTSGVRDMHLQGKGLMQTRVQIDCYATTYRVAEQLHDAVRTAIDGYEIGATVNGVLLDGISYVTENDAFDDDIHVFRKSADYMVRVKY